MILSATKYYALAILAVFFWSFNVIVGSYMQDILLPWQIAFIRWAIAACILIPFTYKDILKNKEIYLKHWKLIIFAAMIGITLSNTFVYYASYTTSAVDMSLISVTGPIFLIVFAYFFGNAIISMKQRIGLLLALIGVITIILHGRFLDYQALHFQSGDVWMFLTAITFGLYSFLMSKKPKELKQLPLLCVTITLGALFCVPMFVYECTINPLDATNVNWTTGGIMLFIGVFNSVLSYLFWNMALEKVGSLKAGVVYYLMPVFSTVEAYFILNENVFMSQFYGGILILIGIYLANAATRKKFRFERP